MKPLTATKRKGRVGFAPENAEHQRLRSESVREFLEMRDAVAAKAKASGLARASLNAILAEDVDKPRHTA